MLNSAGNGNTTTSSVELDSKLQASMHCSRGSYAFRQVVVVVVVVIVGKHAKRHFSSCTAMYSVRFKTEFAGRVTLPANLAWQASAQASPAKISSDSLPSTSIEMLVTFILVTFARSLVVVAANVVVVNVVVVTVLRQSGSNKA